MWEGHKGFLDVVSTMPWRAYEHLVKFYGATWLCQEYYDADIPRPPQAGLRPWLFCVELPIPRASEPGQ